MTNETATTLRRLKGLLIITSDRMRANQPEIAMNTLALAMETMGTLSPEDIDTGMMLDSDLGDLMPHDESTAEVAPEVAEESFATMMARLTSAAR